MQTIREGQPDTIDSLGWSFFDKAKLREYKSGEIVYKADSPKDTRVHFVRDGHVITYVQLESGQKVGLEMVHPGEFFGFDALIGPHISWAKCTTDSHIFSWDIPTLERSDPDILIQLNRIIVRQLLDSQRRIIDFASMHIDERLAVFLRDNARDTTEVEGDLVLPLITHEIIGWFIGTSREIVSSVMSQFRRIGYITYPYRHKQNDPIRVLRPDNFLTRGKRRRS